MDIPSSITPPIDLTKAFGLETAKDQPVDRAKIKMLAQEFEAMLLLQMVRQMRQSLLMDEEDRTGLGNETMTDTVDTEFARYLAQAGGIGLQQIIARQVSEQTNTSSTGAASTEPATAAPAIAPASLTSARAALPNAEADLSALLMPLESATTSGFGWRADPLHGRRTFHTGVDLRAAYGTDVPAAGAGTVIFAGERGGYGLMVVVEHEKGIETRYAHLASTAVQIGEEVTAGQVLGRVGGTGRSTGPHLHFEVLRDGERVDPSEVTVRKAAEVAARGL